LETAATNLDHLSNFIVPPKRTLSPPRYDWDLKAVDNLSDLLGQESATSGYRYAKPAEPFSETESAEAASENENNVEVQDEQTGTENEEIKAEEESEAKQEESDGYVYKAPETPVDLSIPIDTEQNEIGEQVPVIIVC